MQPLRSVALKYGLCHKAQMPIAIKLPTIQIIKVIRNFLGGGGIESIFRLQQRDKI